MSRRRLATVLVVVCLLLAGCSGGGSAGGGDAEAGRSDGEFAADAEAAATGTPMATAQKERANDEGRSQETRAAQADRAIIKTGRMTLTVDSFTTARERVASIARDRGGYVASGARETRGRDNQTWTVGVVQIRVPSEEFDETYAALKDLGTVQEASQDTRDVSDQLVDIEARLETLRAERARLRGLYDEANDTEDVLRISEKLSDVQTEIERLEARKRNLKNQVAYSTITVELRERPPETPTPTPKPGYTDTALGAAFAASVNGVVTVVKAAAVTVAYALPYLLAFGVPLGGLGAVLVHRRR